MISVHNLSALALAANGEAENLRVLPSPPEVVVVVLMRVLYLFAVPHRPEECPRREHLDLVGVVPRYFLRGPQLPSVCAFWLKENRTYPWDFHAMLCPAVLIERLV